MFLFLKRFVSEWEYQKSTGTYPIQTAWRDLPNIINSWKQLRIADDAGVPLLRVGAPGASTRPAKVVRRNTVQAPLSRDLLHN